MVLPNSTTSHTELQTTTQDHKVQTLASAGQVYLDKFMVTFVSVTVSLVDF